MAGQGDTLNSMNRTLSSVDFRVPALIAVVAVALAPWLAVCALSASTMDCARPPCPLSAAVSPARVEARLAMNDGEPLRRVPVSGDTQRPYLSWLHTVPRPPELAEWARFTARAPSHRFVLAVRLRT